MPIELASLIKPDVLRMLEDGELEELREACDDIHAADLEALVADLDVEVRSQFFEALSFEKQIETFAHFATDVQCGLLDGMTAGGRRRLLNGLSPDDRVLFLSSLDEDQAASYIAQLNTQERLYTEALMRCEEGTAGRMMSPKFLSIASSDTVDEAFAHIRANASRVETIYVAYIVDSTGLLLGTVSLRDLLKAKPTDVVDDIMTIEPVSVTVDTKQEKVAEVGRKYDLLAVPVTTTDGRLAGIVTHDDISDVQSEEASEDILRMAGVATDTESYFEAPMLLKYRSRMVVLASLAGVSILSVLLQEHFNHLIDKVSILAIYLTMLAGSSGNCGTQIAGIVIRAQALHDIDQATFKKMILRELLVGLGMAMTMAVAISALVWIQSPAAEYLGGNTVERVALTVGIAMFGALVTINLLGGAIPVLMKRMKLDPAITAGPFITTTADIMTVFVYFTLAGWLLG